LGSDYLVLHSEEKSASILLDQQEKATLTKIGEGSFKLQEKEGNYSWTLTNKVDGEVRPFSIACYENGGNDSNVKLERQTLKIKSRVFSHNGNFYSIGGAIPNNISPKDIISHDKKYVCRLINFPFSNVDHIDEETRHKLRMHKGISVGDIHGLGTNGFHLTLYGNELNDIGLPLSAAAYLLYTTR